MATRRSDEGYYERADREEGFPLATAIRWSGIIAVTIIAAYFGMQILQTLQVVFG